MKTLTDKQQQEKIVLEGNLEKWINLFEGGITDDKVKAQIHCYATKYYQLTGEFYHRTQRRTNNEHRR